MVKRDITQLAVYQIDREADTIPMGGLCRLYLEKASEIIYITKGRELYGIVCIGEVLSRYKYNGNVKINKSFTFLTGFNVVRASEIFHKCKRIHKIPVVNEKGELLGDYSRWDDILYIKRNQERLMREEVVKQIVEPYDTVYVVEPVESRDQEYLQLLKYLKKMHIKYEVIGKGIIGEKLFENVFCIFLTEDEKRGTLCLYEIEPKFYDELGWDIHRYDKLADSGYKARMTTYSNLLFHIEEKKVLSQLNLCKTIDIPYERLDIKTSVLLSALEEQGIKTYSLCYFEEENSEYRKKFIGEMYERLREKAEETAAPFTSAVDREGFYGELLQIEDYKKEIAQNEIFYSENVFEYKKNIVGKYFNAQNGRRITCFKPLHYIGTIYLVGMCTVIGGFVEDQYTIASYLQKMLLERGYMYRVENYASMIRPDASLDSRLEEMGSYCSNDMVIYVSGSIQPVNVAGSLEKIFQQKNIPSEWVKDGYTHCNHKANKYIAESMMKLVETDIATEEAGNGERTIYIDWEHIMKNYVANKYLCQYFMDFFHESNYSIGAVVMGADPFHNGHRYLIDQALDKVNFLIVFVLDQIESVFSFEERFEMISMGTADIDNIMIVPGGDFVLSRNNFPEYYTQNYNLTVNINARYDIDMFADFIAKPLHITYRFAGKGTKGRVNKVYYDTMEKILSQKGIEFVEIPRMTVEGEVINTKQIQKYMENKVYDEVFARVPDSTKQYLMKLLSLA